MLGYGLVICQNISVLTSHKFAKNMICIHKSKNFYLIILLSAVICNHTRTCI